MTKCTIDKKESEDPVTWEKGHQGTWCSTDLCEHPMASQRLFTLCSCTHEHKTCSLNCSFLWPIILLVWMSKCVGQCHELLSSSTHLIVYVWVSSPPSTLGSSLLIGMFAILFCPHSGSITFKLRNLNLVNLEIALKQWWCQDRLVWGDKDVLLLYKCGVFVLCMGWIFGERWCVIILSYLTSGKHT